MALKSIRIENFKSIGEIEIVNPQPFSVLVGANAAGKSNIFAALQFLHHLTSSTMSTVLSGFGGGATLSHFNLPFNENIVIYFNLSDRSVGVRMKVEGNGKEFRSGSSSNLLHGDTSNDDLINERDYSLHLVNFTRLFVGQSSIVFQSVNDESKLAADASNLEKVLKRLLNDPVVKDEFIEMLELFIPGLERVDVVSSEFSSNLDLLVYEKALKRPIDKELISDGTYNIIAILTALYQSKTPQFLCIEEPENGLNPYVCKHLVALCKDLCEERGHYIWLNTHSQSIVSQLKPEEIILVDKIDGFTRVKQFEKGSFEGMPMDEAWLTNSLGGGLPW